MNIASILFSVLILLGPASVLCAQLSGHKSESEVGRMTPEQRVEEYCREYARHGARHGDYTGMVHSDVMRDGLRAVPASTRIIDEYDPTTPAGRSTEKGERLDAAVGLLVAIDQTVVRLRASQEGRAAIAATKRAVERMRAAGFQNDPDLDHEKQVWYEFSVDALQRMDGLNWLDNAIGDTLRIKFKIRLTDQQLLDFVNYLISRDPYYPDGIGTALYKDFDDLTPAGYPRQHHMLTYIEPFHKAYREYKAKTK